MKLVFHEGVYHFGKMDKEFMNNESSKFSGISQVKILDNRIFSYKHCLCNEALHVTQSKERQDKVTKMIEKNLQKIIKMNNKVPRSVCGDNVQGTCVSKEAAVRKSVTLKML